MRSPTPARKPYQAPWPGRLALAGGLALMLTACGTGSEPCEQIAKALERCDLPPPGRACELLTNDQQTLLAERFNPGSCTFLDDNTLEPQPRICDLLGWTCPPPLFARPVAQPTRYPIVFVSGIDSSPTFDWNSQMLGRVQAMSGSEVHHVGLSPWALPEVRANDLYLGLRSLAAQQQDMRFNLICYAVGGIDCRYLISPGGLFADRPQMHDQTVAMVASVTTVATPHRGTDVARVAKEVLEGPTATEFIGAFIGSPQAALAEPEALAATLEALTPPAMVQLNSQLPDAAGVLYQSWAGFSQLLPPPLGTSDNELSRYCRDETGQLLLARAAGTADLMSPVLAVVAPFSNVSINASGESIYSPSDGMVSIESAKWGAFRGCIPADHYDVIGQIGDRGQDPNTGFDAATFYANVAVDLAKRGL